MLPFGTNKKKMPVVLSVAVPLPACELPKVTAGVEPLSVSRTSKRNTLPLLALFALAVADKRSVPLPFATKSGDPCEIPMFPCAERRVIDGLSIAVLAILLARMFPTAARVKETLAFAAP